MIRDAELGLFDLVVTKEVTRFARNTVDTLVYARLLKKNGIYINFLLDEISTERDDYETRLTDKASNAQEESRKTSKRVVFGQAMKMREGVVFGEKIFGYTLENGKLTINEKQAEIVRLIFHMYIQEGKGSGAIAKELREKGILTTNGTLNWSGATILRMLKNEKYVGDLLQGKTYTPDYLTHASKRNYGESPMVFIENHHEAIVSRETFDKARKIIEERKQMFSENASRYSARHAFSGKVRCSCCGAVYVSRYRKLRSGFKYHYWECGNKSLNGKVHGTETGQLIGCNSHMVKNMALEEITLQLFKHLAFDKEKIKSSIVSILEKSLKQYETGTGETIAKIEGEIEQVRRKKRKIIDLCTTGIISQGDLREMNIAYDEELEELHEELARRKNEKQATDAFSEIVKKISERVDKILSFETFDAKTYRNVIDKVVVIDKFHWEFHIKKILEGTENFKVSLALLDKLCVPVTPHVYLPMKPFGYTNSDIKLKRQYCLSCLSIIPKRFLTKESKAGYSNVEVDVIFNL